MRTCQWSGEAMKTASKLLIEDFAIIDVAGGGETVRAQFYGVTTRGVDVNDGYDLVVW